MSDKLDKILFKKIGPLPVAVYLLAAVVAGVILWKKYRGGGGGDAEGGGTDWEAPSASSPDSGSFTGNNTLSLNGSEATMSSAGALLTGGFVGQPGGYQFAPPAGDVFVNVPTPTKITNVITSHGDHHDKPPKHPKKKPKHKDDHDDDDHKKKKKKKDDHDDHKKKPKKKSKKKSSHSTSQKGNSGGGVSINLNN